MRRSTLLLLIAAGYAAAVGQVRILSVTQLPLPSDRLWMAPSFAPDGKTLFLTSAGYQGIWRYSPADGTLLQITDAPGAGYGFAVSRDGSRIAYRKTVFGATAFDRTQEILETDLRLMTAVPVAQARDLSVPAYYGDKVLHQQSADIGSLPAPAEPDVRTAVLGIEQTRIALLIDGKKTLLDPFGGGSYIWPALSPDGTRLVAYEMSRGAFVCDLSGTVLAMLGRCDAPAWTRSGAWIVYADSRDDGHALVSSDLMAVSPDGQRRVRLTETPAIELMPACSPADNRLVCVTPAGEIFLLTYEEEGR